MKAILGWSIVLGLLWIPARSGNAAGRDSAAPLAERLLGPVASVAASVQWVRADAAIDRGRPELGLARAQSALALDPGSTNGWLFLCNHLAFHRASAEREPHPARRVALMRAGLELAARGEELAQRPELLARWRGLARVAFAETPGLPWPGGQRALLLAAVEDFERAAALGLADGAELAAGVRRRLPE